MKFPEEFAPLAGRSHLQVLAQTDSTNNRVKDLADAGAPSGAAVIADRQTAGRGRLGRSFSSPAGVGLYLSYLLRPTLPEDRLMTVPALAAVAGTRAVRRAAGLDCGIKWPNDLVCAGRKVSGILTELVPTQSGPAVVIGIGINVHEQTFSPDAAQVAGYLDAWTDRPVSRGELAKALLEELDGLETLDGLREYRAACLTLGRTVRLLRPDGTQQAEALDIDRDYGLIVRYGDGREETVRSGEVSVRGLYGYIE